MILNFGKPIQPIAEEKLAHSAVSLHIFQLRLWITLYSQTIDLIFPNSLAKEKLFQILVLFLAGFH